MTTATRRTRQLVIASLLEELEQRRRRLYRLRARGVQPAGLRDLEDELAAAQQRLLEVVAA